MTVLSSEQILERLRDTTARDRLYIKPILVPSEQLRKGQASIDLRLGSHFSFPETTVNEVVDTIRHPQRKAPLKEVFIPVGSSIVLHPQGFLLGLTLEFVRMPTDLMAYVVGRSSWGREGLIVATAVGVHSGFRGPITLELRNLGEIPIRLYPGDSIAQLFIHTVSGRPDIDMGGAERQFEGAARPTIGELRYSITQQKLSALATKTAQTTSDTSSSTGSSMSAGPTPAKRS
jgi:dCTP deaminase